VISICSKEFFFLKNISFFDQSKTVDVQSYTHFSTETSKNHLKDQHETWRWS
jgi:hypothetical protein